MAKKLQVEGPKASEAELIRFGTKLRHARLARRLRLKDVADKAGCSESMLSKIENDRVAPSIGLLHRLVSALGTNISALFEQTPSGCVTRLGARPIIQQGNDAQGGISLELLTPFPSPALFQSGIHAVPPQAVSDGMVEHEGEDFGYILEGTIELHVAEETYILHAGDTFYFPSNLPHAYRNPGEVMARVLWFNTPPTF